MPGVERVANFSHRWRQRTVLPVRNPRDVPSLPTPEFRRNNALQIREIVFSIRDTNLRETLVPPNKTERINLDELFFARRFETGSRK